MNLKIQVLKRNSCIYSKLSSRGYNNIPVIRVGSCCLILSRDRGSFEKVREKKKILSRISSSPFSVM